MLNVVIQRKKHLRGQKSPSCMRNENGSMCCLGFAAVAAGIPKECLLNKQTPYNVYIHGNDNVRSILEKYNFVLFDNNPKVHSPIMCELMDTNDSAILSSKAKEKEIIRLGKQIGINFSFV